MKVMKIKYEDFKILSILEHTWNQSYKKNVEFNQTNWPLQIAKVKHFEN